MTHSKFRTRLIKAVIIALTTLLWAPVWPSSVGAASDTLILRPNAAGSATAVSSQNPATGAHWDKVDDPTADNGTTSVYTSSTSYEQDLYAIPDHSTESGTINSVTVYFRYGMQNSVKGNVYARSVIKTNGSTYTGTEQTSSSKTKWNDISDQWALNPYTGSAWTWTEIDALEIGVELMGDGTAEGACTQVYVEVVHEIPDAQPDIGNSPTGKAFGNVAQGSSYWSKGSEPHWALGDNECFFSVTNNGSSPVDISIRATNFTGGVGWTLAATPGVNIATLKAGKSGDATEGNMVVLTTSDQPFISGLPGSNTMMWEVKLETPTSFTDGIQKTSTITLTASTP